MSFLAKLIIDDQEYNVLEMSFGVTQQSHQYGRPIGRPVFESISIQIESTSSTDFFGWMINPSEFKNGEIIFYKRDTMASSRSLKFENASCVGYHEHFNSRSKNPMVLTIELVVQTAEIDNSIYENPEYNEGSSG